MASCLSNEDMERLCSEPQPSGEWAAPLLAHLEACSECQERLSSWKNEAKYLENVQQAWANASQTDSKDESGLCSRLEIPGYQMLGEIHRGGQGIVFKAVQISTLRNVAIKVLPGGALASEEARWRFEREVKLVAKLKHPNIVVIHESGITEGRYYYAMDYVSGEHLDAYVASHNLSTSEIVRIFILICGAVSYAHRRGVIHRDLKPSNILVTDDGTPFVLDFGLAKLVGDEADTRLVSQTGRLMGTLRYMSPEQTEGNQDKIDSVTDVYSLGIILYELLTGLAPYDTQNCDPMVAIRNIRETYPLKPSKLKRVIRPDLDAVILKALHKEPGRRYSSAEQLRDDLVAWLDGRAVSARSDSSLYVLRKLAAKHYFHTSVIVALVASIIGFSGVSFHYLQQSRADLREKSISEAHAKMAYKDMDKFFSEAQNTLRQQAFGWFLLEWQNDRLDRARQIQAQLRSDTPEFTAMAFLLDDRSQADQLSAKLAPGAEPLLHFVLGERFLKTGQPQDARREFELSQATKDRRLEWFKLASLARLRQLQTSSQPAAQVELSGGGDNR